MGQAKASVQKTVTFGARDQRLTRALFYALKDACAEVGINCITKEQYHWMPKNEQPAPFQIGEESQTQDVVLFNVGLDRQISKENAEIFVKAIRKHFRGERYLSFPLKIFVTVAMTHEHLSSAKVVFKK